MKKNMLYVHVVCINHLAPEFIYIDSISKKKNACFCLQVHAKLGWDYLFDYITKK